jgi:hypothetical protein
VSEGTAAVISLTRGIVLVVTTFVADHRTVVGHGAFFSDKAPGYSSTDHGGEKLGS